MNNMKKRMTVKSLLLVPALAAVLVLTGCTSTGNSGAPATATASHLTQILKSKTIRIAVSAETAPWGSLNASGEYEGFDIDMAKALGESLGAKVEFVSATNESRIPLLQTAKADAVVASFSATDARAQTVDFSIPYASTATVFAVPKDSPIKSYADLAGKSISSTRGSGGEKLLQSQFPGSKAVLFASFADSVQALKSRKVDAFVELSSIIGPLVATDSSFRILDGPALVPTLTSIGIRQGDQQWLNYLNTFIRNYTNSGADEAAYEKWFHTTMPASLK